MGPVIRGERKTKLIEYIDGAQSEGAHLVSDGRHVDQEDGFFLGPTIFDKVTPTMKIWKEELFGPVLSVMRASDIDDALNLLNSSTSWQHGVDLHELRQVRTGVQAPWPRPACSG